MRRIFSFPLICLVLSASSLALWSTSGVARWIDPLHYETVKVSHFDTELMAMDPKLQDAFNQQVVDELIGAYIYLDLAEHFKFKSLDGIGKWFTAQFYEEVNHARILTNFLGSKGVEVKLKPLTAPSVAKGTPLEIYQAGLAIEVEQTQRINKLYELAQSLNQHDVVSFLKFFLDEQVQEEDMFRRVVDKLKIIGNDPAGLLALDRELGARAIPAAFVPAAGATPGAPAAGAVPGAPAVG